MVLYSIVLYCILSHDLQVDHSPAVMSCSLLCIHAKLLPKIKSICFNVISIGANVNRSDQNSGSKAGPKMSLQYLPTF